MQIVIEIPDERYKEIVESSKPVMIYRSDVAKVLVNGTPLPKGHGDLIDKSNLLTVTEYDGENEKTYVLYEEIEDAQPIIEADTENK